MSVFCTQCGHSPLARRIPPGDSRTRHVCDRCSFVHYVNPKMVVGCIVHHGGSLLLCKRAIEPCLGLWTVPGGFLEVGEDTMAGAMRETWEEAEARTTALRPFCHLDIPHIAQAYVLFEAAFAGEPTYGAGEETLESRLVPVDDIAWETLAFPVVSAALRLYVGDLRTQQRRMHWGTLETPPEDGYGTARLQVHHAWPLA